MVRGGKGKRTQDEQAKGWSGSSAGKRINLLSQLLQLATRSWQQLATPPASRTPSQKGPEEALSSVESPRATVLGPFFVLLFFSISVDDLDAVVVQVDDRRSNPVISAYSV